MKIFYRAFLATLGIIGRILNFFIIKIHDVHINNKILKSKCKKEYDMLLKKLNFGFDENVYNKIVNEICEYRVYKIAKIKSRIDLNEKDEIDLNYFFNVIKHIQLIWKYRKLK